jgi:hypothetical protein
MVIKISISAKFTMRKTKHKTKKLLLEVGFQGEQGGESAA